jgi:hypothetical protein
MNGKSRLVAMKTDISFIFVPSRGPQAIAGTAFIRITEQKVYARLNAVRSEGKR